MKIILMCAQNTGIEIAHYIANQAEDEIVALYLSEENNTENSSEKSINEQISLASCLNANRIFSHHDLNNTEHVGWLKKEEVDFIVSVYWPHIIRDEILALAQINTVNCHPSLLPYNRGSYPHVFVLLENTPCGVSLHQLTSELDAGPVWVQREINVFPQDTLESLYTRLQAAIVELFMVNWPLIRENKITPIIQDELKATTHKSINVKACNKIDLERQYTGQEWLNLLRARSMRNQGFAFFEVEGQKIYINLRLGLSENFENDCY